MLGKLALQFKGYFQSPQCHTVDKFAIMLRVESYICLTRVTWVLSEAHIFLIPCMWYFRVITVWASFQSVDLKLYRFMSSNPTWKYVWDIAFWWSEWFFLIVVLGFPSYNPSNYWYKSIEKMQFNPRTTSVISQDYIFIFSYSSFKAQQTN